MPRGYPERQRRRHGSPWCLFSYPIARALVGRGLGPVVLPVLLAAPAPEPVPGSPLEAGVMGPGNANHDPAEFPVCALAKRLCAKSPPQSCLPSSTTAHAHSPHPSPLTPHPPFPSFPSSRQTCCCAQAGAAEPRSTPEPQPESEPVRPAAPLFPDHDFSRFRAAAFVPVLEVVRASL